MIKSLLSPQKGKVRTFRSRLCEDLKDPEFKAHYQEELQALKLALTTEKLKRLKKKMPALSTDAVVKAIRADRARH